MDSSVLHLRESQISAVKCWHAGSAPAQVSAVLLSGNAGTLITVNTRLNSCWMVSADVWDEWREQLQCGWNNRKQSAELLWLLRGVSATWHTLLWHFLTFEKEATGGGSAAESTAKGTIQENLTGESRVYISMTRQEQSNPQAANTHQSNSRFLELKDIFISRLMNVARSWSISVECCTSCRPPRSNTEETRLCLKQLCDFFSQEINYIYTHTHSYRCYVYKTTDGIAPQFLQSCEKTLKIFKDSSVCLIM